MATAAKPILVSSAVLVDAPSEDFELLSEISQGLMHAVRQFAATRADCIPVNGTSYHYLGDEYENAARCSRCSNWTTDTDRPEAIDCIGCESFIEGRFLCEQCRIYLIDVGVLPDPMRDVEPNEP